MPETLTDEALSRALSYAQRSRDTMPPRGEERAALYAQLAQAEATIALTLTTRALVDALGTLQLLGDVVDAARNIGGALGVQR